MKKGSDEKKKCHFRMGKSRFQAIPHSLGYYHCPGTAGHAVGTSESLSDPLTHPQIAASKVS